MHILYHLKLSFKVENFLFLSQSALCTWNIDRRSIDPNKPDASIDLSVSKGAQKDILYNKGMNLHFCHLYSDNNRDPHHFAHDGIEIVT